MAKTDILLMELLSGEEESQAGLFFEHLMNKGIKRVPRIAQFGIKQGQSLRAHIQNVVSIAHHLSRVLRLDDGRRMDLLAASFVHDINKLPRFQGKPYGEIAVEENVQAFFEEILQDSDISFDFSTENVVSLIRAHSGHHHVDGDGLFASGSDRNEMRKMQIAILQAADTWDLSHHFHEKVQKEKALMYLNNGLNDRQFEYTWHFFSDNRGIFTNLIHNVVADLHRQEGAIPLLFYPQGVWYLTEKEKRTHISAGRVERELSAKMKRMSVVDPSKALRYAKVGFNYNIDPFQAGISAEKVVDVLVKQIIERDDRKYADKYEELTGKSGKKAFKAFLSGEKKVEKTVEKESAAYGDLVRKHGLKEDFEKEDPAFTGLSKAIRNRIEKSKKKKTAAARDLAQFETEKRRLSWDAPPEDLFDAAPDAMRCGDLVSSFALLLKNHLGIDSKEAWDKAAEVAGLDAPERMELKYFDVQSDRGFRTAALLYEKQIDFSAIQDRYIRFLRDRSSDQDDGTEEPSALLEYISANFRTPENQFRFDGDALKGYMESDHCQCSHCGEKGGVESQSGNLPGGIKVQLFSNRLIGGHGSKVKRNLCDVCVHGFQAEKLVSEAYDNHYYLHLFADGGERSSHAEPAFFLESLKNAVAFLRQSDGRGFLVQPNAAMKKSLAGEEPRLEGTATQKNGIVVPKFSESVAGVITLGVNPPGGKTSNDGTRFVFSLMQLLVFTRQLNLRGILSKSSIPPLKSEEFAKLYIDHVPLAFQALIPQNDLDTNEEEALWDKFSAVFGLRNTYDPLDDKEIVRICRTMFDPVGLDTIHYMKNAFDKNRRTKDYPPWNKAWPYLKPFIAEEKLMPIKKLAQIALESHFHGKTFKATSQAKPLDLAFEALSKHRPPETEEDLKMVILHDVVRGLERISPTSRLGREKAEAARLFAETFYEELLNDRYRCNKTRIVTDQKRIRAAFLGYLSVIREERKEKNEKEKRQ